MWYFIGMIIWVVVGTVGFTAYSVFEHGGIGDDDLIDNIFFVFVSAVLWPIMLAGGVLVGAGWLIGNTLNGVSNGRRWLG